MLTIPELPAGLKVDVRPTAQGVRFSWRNRETGIFRYILFAVTCLTGYFGTRFLIYLLRESLKEGTSPGWSVFLLFTACIVGGALAGFVVSALWSLVGPRKCETLELEQEGLTYAPGTLPNPASYVDLHARYFENPFLSWPTLRPPRRKAVASRSEVTAVQLRLVQGLPRLSIDIGAERIEMGKFLDEPEREWLASVLKTWTEGDEARLPSSTRAPSAGQTGEGGELGLEGKAPRQPGPVNEVHGPPAGSVIHIERGARGLRLSWKNPEVVWTRLFHIVWTLFLMCYIATFFAAARFESADALRGARGSVLPVGPTVWLGIWVLAEALVGFRLWKLVRRRKPEKLDLQRETLIHVQGTPVMYSRSSLNPYSGMIYALDFICLSRRRTVASRSEIPAAWLEHKEGRQRLTIEVKGDVIEMGRYLREPEREWLTSVLQAWKESGDNELQKEGDA